MPIYEFRCERCGAVREVLQKFDAPAPACTEHACREAGAVTKRQVSTTNFELRGGGWAKDGYGS